MRATPVIHLDSNGFVLHQDAARPAQGQQAVGVGLMVGGAVVASAEAIVAVLLPTHDVPVKTTFVPAPGGGAILFGSAF